MKIKQAVWLVLVLILGGCAQGSPEITPPEIHYGEDVCVECDMIISDIRFAAGYAYEIEAGRYQSLAFDDIGDMLAHADKHPEHDVVAWYVHDFNSSRVAGCHGRVLHVQQSVGDAHGPGHGRPRHA